MKTKNLLVALSVAILSTSASHAQKVETALEEGKYPVINCEGIPPLAYTTNSKGNTISLLKTLEKNKTVYKRFAVYNSDNSTWSTWQEAFTVCSNLGNSWRLPTQRELQLIWVLKLELEAKITFLFSGIYWSGTESGASDGKSWDVTFTGSDTSTDGDTEPGVTTDNGGATSTNHQTLHYSVRCIKELPIIK